MEQINPVVLDIIKKRGYTSAEDINEYISQKPKRTYDPFLLPNMKEGVDFIFNSIESNERICIYGDYDVDGITSTALLHSFFSKFTENITYFIPSRFEEGYGLNNDALKQIREQGVDTVITVDCGAVSKNEVEYAKQIGLKILITDHHNMEEYTYPECIVINPKHPDSQYPFSELCGCGVAFKLVQAMARTKGISGNTLGEYLDLVAIATVSDVVSLVDENRTLLKYGLRELNKGKRTALRIMTNKLDIKPGTIDSYKIGFIIGPHMNAAGRMKDANAVVRMLITNDNNEIENIVNMLIEHNKERKAVQEKCFEESVELIQKHYLDTPFLMVKPDSIHEGIAGIVAGKIKEKYNKPTIVLSETEDENGKLLLKGSGRSIAGVNLVKTLLSHKHLFTKLGGHAMAAGFSIPRENEEELRLALVEDINRLIKKDPDLLLPKVDWDVLIDENSLNMNLAEDFKLLAPYGLDNPRPVLKIANVKVENVKYMGAENQHVKFGNSIQYVLFGDAHNYEDILMQEQCVDLLGNPDINTWNDRTSLQFIIKTIIGREG